MQSLAVNQKTEALDELAGYAKPPKSKPLKKAIELIHKQDFNKALSERKKFIKFKELKYKSAKVN